MKKVLETEKCVVDVPCCNCLSPGSYSCLVLFHSCHCSLRTGNHSACKEATQLALTESCTGYVTLSDLRTTCYTKWFKCPTCYTWRVLYAWCLTLSELCIHNILHVFMSPLLQWVPLPRQWIYPSHFSVSIQTLHLKCVTYLVQQTTHLLLSTCSAFSVLYVHPNLLTNPIPNHQVWLTAA